MFTFWQFDLEHPVYFRVLQNKTMESLHNFISVVAFSKHWNAFTIASINLYWFYLHWIYLLFGQSHIIRIEMLTWILCKDSREGSNQSHVGSNFIVLYFAKWVISWIWFQGYLIYGIPYLCNKNGASAIKWIVLLHR